MSYKLNPFTSRFDYFEGAGAAVILKVTTVERLALSPSEGDVVFDTTQHLLMYYDGNTWVVA